MKKRIISLVLAVFMTLGFVEVANASAAPNNVGDYINFEPTVDMPTVPTEPWVMEQFGNEIGLRVYQDLSVTVTRGQFLSFFFRMQEAAIMRQNRPYDIPMETTYLEKFADYEQIKGCSPEFVRDINWLVRRNVLEGTMENGQLKLNLDRPLKRDEACALLYRLDKNNSFGLAVRVQEEDMNFQDVPSSHWAYEYIEWAGKHYAVYGKGNNQFAPNSYVRLDEMLKIGFNVIENSASSVILSDFGFALLQTFKATTKYASLQIRPFGVRMRLPDSNAAVAYQNEFYTNRELNITISDPNIAKITEIEKLSFGYRFTVDAVSVGKCYVIAEVVNGNPLSSVQVQVEVYPAELYRN